MDKFEGKRPKDVRELRTTLESLRREDAAPQGAGLQPGDEIPVASFHEMPNAVLFQERMLREGIFSTHRSFAGQTQVLVDARERERAAELLKEHLESHPNNLPSGDRRPLDFAIFGTLLGAALGFCLLLGQFRHWRSVVILLLFCAVGGVTGLFLDYARKRRRVHGKWQFGIGELLALIGLFSIVWLLWRMLVTAYGGL